MRLQQELGKLHSSFVLAELTPEMVAYYKPVSEAFPNEKRLHLRIVKLPLLRRLHRRHGGISIVFYQDVRK